jgi:hypothetical protein
MLLGYFFTQFTMGILRVTYLHTNKASYASRSNSEQLVDPYVFDSFIHIILLNY